jgi:serine/threonine-protein kinase
VPGARFCLSCGTAVTTGGGATIAASAHTFGVTSTGPGLTDADRQAQLTQLLVEATLGEFEILGELGRGGMATVYLAHDLALDRKVAIKVIAPALLSSPGAVERFKREARTAGALSHPHIIPIHSVRETQHLLYFVMKFVEGRSLDDIVREQRRMPIRMVQAILIETGQALAYAHRRGVVHRDIKPANIMIDGEGWAVVTDFGIAKVLESDSLTVSGAMVGTPYYMSPEQCAGKPVTGASDQYSLGVVTYEMLTGHPPFSGETIMEIMKGHFFEIPEAVATVRPDCPAALADAVTRMLAKDPAERWPSMDEAVGAMETTPLAQDDPVRGEMIALARSSEALRRISRLSIPISPMPVGWTRARPLTSSNPAAAPPTVEAPTGDDAVEPSSWGTVAKVAVTVALLAGLGAGAALLARRPALPAPAAVQADSSVTTIPPVDSSPPAPPGPATVTVDSAAVVAESRPPAPGPEAGAQEQQTREVRRYIDAVRGRLQENWAGQVQDPAIPGDARLRYRIVIQSNGVYTPEALDQDSPLDGLAFVAIADLGRLPPLPAALRGASLTLEATFTPASVTLQRR